MRILIVEKDPDANGTTDISAFLNKYGICDVFNEHDTAFKEFAESFVMGRPYPLVCLELEGDGIRAMNLMARMRREEQKWNFPKVHIMLISEAVKPSVVTSAARLGCGAFLLKPLDENLIMAKLDAMNFKQKP